MLRTSTRCLEVRLNGGKFDEERRLIYRTKLTSSDDDFHFRLKWLQLPIRLPFVMTINKAQGQFLDRLCCHWPSNPCVQSWPTLCGAFTGNGSAPGVHTDQGVECRRGYG
jgi:hypothetical protein